MANIRTDEIRSAFSFESPASKESSPDDSSSVMKLIYEPDCSAWFGGQVTSLQEFASSSKVVPKGSPQLVMHKANCDSVGHQSVVAAIAPKRLAD